MIYQITEEQRQQLLAALALAERTSYSETNQDKFIAAHNVLQSLAPVGAEPVDGYYFPLTNETMKDSIDALIAHAKRARWTNAVVRKDGAETTYEADWITCLVPHPAPLDVSQTSLRELSDSEIADIYYASTMGSQYDQGALAFARAVLKAAR